MITACPLRRRIIPSAKRDALFGIRPTRSRAIRGTLRASSFAR
jgi:hypothetical protein